MPAPRGVFALLSCLLITVAAGSAGTPPWLGTPNVAWPPSAGLVLAEVMTGGASASDEYVEIANAGSATTDLGGCELIYVTASGSTITRKAAFTAPLLLEPGQHLLVANSAGIYGPLADATYTGGLAADGGALALRRMDGNVVDSVGWGSASNSYVEGAVAPAPPAKSSLERLPGGSNGNTQDTNENKADWFVQPVPVPQSLAARPVPGSSPTPSPTSTTTTPSATESPTTAPTDTAAPTASGSTSATASAEDSGPPPTAEARPTAEPTAVPTATDTPIPTDRPTTTPTASRTPAPSGTGLDLLPIGSARGLPSGTPVHVEGVVTSEVGLAGDGLFAVQDSSGGIFVRPPTGADEISPGALVEVQGTLAAPYGQLEIRNLSSLVVGAAGKGFVAAPVALSDVGEATEGSLVTITGPVESVATDSGRLTILVSDGVTVVRVLADPPVGILRTDVARGDVVDVAGIVGQYASATGRLDGYRLWPRGRDDLVVEHPDPIDPPPASGPAPTQTSVFYDLASALGTRGALVDVEAVVTAQAGLADISGPTIVVDDGSAAAAVVVPAGSSSPRIGMKVRVTGKIGRWQGGPTVLATRLEDEGELAAVSPRSTAGPLDASLEWQLVLICGRVSRYTAAGSRWVLEVTTAGHSIQILGEPAAGISMSKAAVGRLAVAVGIVRRSSSDSSVFQLLPRTAADLRLGPGSSTGSSDTGGSARGSGSASAGGEPAMASAGRAIEIGSASDHVGETVTVTGLVLEKGDGTATLDDGTGRVRVGGSSAASAISALAPGDAVEVTGVVNRDDKGLLIEADPESIVDLPADRAAPIAEDTGGALATQRLAGISAAAATPVVPNAMPRGQSGAQFPPGGPAVLLLIAILLLAGAAAVATARSRLPWSTRGGPPEGN